MIEKKRIAFQTLGCKLNFSETSSISRQSGLEGYVSVDFNKPADIYVINSCSVTSNAEKRCRTLIKQALQVNPDAHIAVIGCFSQINPEELKTIPGVDIVLGNSDKFNLFEHIRHLESDYGVNRNQEIAVHEPDVFVPSYSMDDRTRSFFKIQDGCDYFCSYCTIPLARGRSRSNTIAQTIRTAAAIADTNMKEVVLSGVNIGDFGKEHGESFFDFLRELVKVDGLERIRISSVEPDLLHDEIIELIANTPKLMPHFHIPLQSGSDEVLRAMGRRYDTDVFLRRVEKIKSLMPQACIAADLIVGFPAETDHLFDQSMEFISKTKISYVHVFTYSERENTRAISIDSQVSLAERSRRSKLMHKLSEQKKRAFYMANTNHYSKVLWEKDNIRGFMYGFTENYIKVRKTYNELLVNEIEDVRLVNLDSDGVFHVS
jgi:threonylcarbamoyladenosine tRNA methylthiotransferase MtaB